MNNKEIYITFIINTIFSLRMLGIFMVLPVLSTYGMQLTNADISLIGIAIGIYGIIQIIFQVPLGFISDNIGRKPVIIGGLLLSLIGTSISAITNNIWGIIIGRAFQGASAISGTLLALVSDLIRKKNHTKVMMIIGINFSITFSTSIILGPIITNQIELQGLFFTITILTLLGIILTLLYIPNSHKNIIRPNKIKILKINKFLKILTQPQLIILNLSIFLLHTIMTLNFISIPKIMNLIHLLPYEQSKIYLISLLTSLIISAKTILHAEKKRNMKKLLIISIYILFFSEIIFFHMINNLFLLTFGNMLFFIGFNLAEGILPAILTKETLINHKGTTTGIFSTSQFLGTSCGGILGGYILKIYNNIQIIFFLEIILTTIWIIIITSLKEPHHKE